MTETKGRKVYEGMIYSSSCCKLRRRNLRARPMPRATDVTVTVEVGRGNISLFCTHHIFARRRSGGELIVSSYCHNHPAHTQLHLPLSSTLTWWSTRWPQRAPKASSSTQLQSSTRMTGRKNCSHWTSPRYGKKSARVSTK